MKNCPKCGLADCKDNPCVIFPKDKEFEVVTWDSIKDKRFDIFIPTLDRAIEWLRGLGVPVTQREDGTYWMTMIPIDEKKLKGDAVHAKEEQ